MTDRGDLEAVAFDCDGTIADTESLSSSVWSEMLRERGVAFDASDFQLLVGRPFEANWEHFRRRGDLGEEVSFRGELRDRFRARFEEHVEIHDDVVATMRDVAVRGFGIAIVSSSTREHVDRVLSRAGVAHLPTVVIAAGDTVAHKPAPDPYLAACARLDVTPSRASAVEDTPTGARSSRDAGLWTVGVRRAHSVPELAQHAHLVVDHLRTIDLRPGGDLD